MMVHAVVRGGASAAGTEMAGVVGAMVDVEIDGGCILGSVVLFTMVWTHER